MVCIGLGRKSCTLRCYFQRWSLREPRLWNEEVYEQGKIMILMEKSQHRPQSGKLYLCFMLGIVYESGTEAVFRCAGMGERTAQVHTLSLWWNYHAMLVTGACCMPHAYLHGAWFCFWMLNLLLLCLVSPWSCHSAPTSSSKPNYLLFKPRTALSLEQVRRAPHEWW